ncbi:MAG: GTP-binding protein [Clostridia bacterium]|nr:GTP-binding protein [Clostridia bacterium]
MVKIDIISGFLGAGKTTLIKKLLKEALNGEKVVLLENEFGDVGIDGGFMKEAGIEVTEMNSGCTCCTLVGDFSKSLIKIIEDYNPERIIIEPSGVGKLSDVISAVEAVEGLSINVATAVVDATKCKMYSKNFGEFYNNQLESATAIVLSRTGNITQDKLDKAMEIIRTKNEKAPVVTTDWDALSGAEILAAMEGAAKDLMEDVCPHCGGHHDEHHHHHDHECDCHEHLEHHHDHDCDCHEHHEHHHDHDCDCHEHHEHHHDHDCGCHEHHEHHHDHDCGCHEHHEHHHDHDCGCGCHGHHHEHHHHHADEVFQSLGLETAKKLNPEKIKEALIALEDGSCGIILRSKGILPKEDNTWFQFDYVPGEFECRDGSADYTGRIVFIGTDLDEHKIKEIFGL